MPSVRDVTSETLGFLELVGFFVPGPEGIVLALGAAGIRSLIELFWEADEGGVNLIVSTGEAVIDSVEFARKHIESTTWEFFEAEHLSKLKMQTEFLGTAMNQILNAENSLGKSNEIFEQDWHDILQGVKRECGRESELLLLMNWIMEKSNDPYRHFLTPVYLLSASVYLSFCSTALLMETLELSRDYTRKYDAWLERNPNGETEGGEPPPKKVVLMPEDMVGSPFHALMVEKVEKFIKHGSERLADLEQCFTDMEAAEQAEFDSIETGMFGNDVRHIIKGKATSKSMEFDQYKLVRWVWKARISMDVRARFREERNLERLERTDLEEFRTSLNTMKEIQAQYAGQK